MTHTIRKLAAALVLVLLAPLAFAQGAVAPRMFTPFKTGGASVSSGSAVSGCTAYSIVTIDASGNLKCLPSSVVNGSVSTAGRSILTIRDTITGASATSNWLNLTGTFNATLTSSTWGANVDVVADNDAQNQSAIRGAISGAGGNADISGVRGDASSTGTFAFGVEGTSTGAATRGFGVFAYATGATNNYGGAFQLSSTTTPAAGTTALYADNSNVAANIFVAADNGTPVFTIANGGNITIGTSNTISDANGRSFTSVGLFAQNGNALALGNNGVATAYVPAATLAWTAATMNLTVPTYRTQTTQCAWTNAMVTALGASLTGDITCATLPAKTRVESALLVIDTAAGGVTTLTVSCGDAIGGTPFTNYIVASDAKAAANTVYGDLISGAETGTSLFDATTKWRNNYVPSYTATTLVTCHFISTGTNLNTVTTSTGRLILTTTLLP